MTTPLNGASRTTATTTGSSSAATAGFDKDMFMKLLVAQLKHQNPMSPSDGNEYMNQVAVFAQVEKLGQLLTSQQASQAMQERLSAQSMVGRQVTGAGLDAVSHTGTVTGVDLGGATPTLTLSDGTTLKLDDITTVEQAPQ